MTTADITADLKARIARRYRRSSSATGIPQHVVMFEVPVDSVETQRDRLLARPADDAHRAGLLGSDDPWLDTPAKRRRIDALAVGQWGPASGRLIGLEVKATRGDLLTELRDPLKAEAGARYCHEWWLVLPALSLADGLDLPERWGILTPHAAGLKARRHAQAITPQPATPRLVAAIAASATTQAIANDVRGLRTIAAELAARYGHADRFGDAAAHPELLAWRTRLDDQHARRFPAADSVTP